MRLKYFLRGLGIGIVVTTIILAISHSTARKMSDSEVIERAAELGMGYTTAAQESGTESSSEPELNREPESSEAETATQEPSSTREAETTQRETTTQEVTSAVTTQETTTETATTEAATTQGETEASTAVTYTLTITGGMSSNTVCDMLKRNGIITDSGDFDDFLVRNGYADRIRVGSFEVNSAMSYDELAATFCSR